jgi:hypothetical protein
MAHHLVRPELRKFVGRGLNIKSRRCLPTLVFCRSRFSDFMAKEEGCEPAAPLAKEAAPAPEAKCRSGQTRQSREAWFLSAGDRGFESLFLHRRVIYEPDSSIRAPNIFHRSPGERVGTERLSLWSPSMDGASGQQVPALIAVFELAGTAVARCSAAPRWFGLTVIPNSDAIRRKSRHHRGATETRWQWHPRCALAQPSNRRH